MSPPKNSLSVLIVDDSVVFRSAVAGALEDQEDIKVVGSVRNGVKALEFINPLLEAGKLKADNGQSHEEAFGKLPDVITLDVEMPEMDGLTTLNEIQKIKASLVLKFPALSSKLTIIMVSAHTHKGAETTIMALEGGAFDFVPKPISNSEKESIDALKLHLLPKIGYIASRRNKYRAEKKPLLIRKEVPRRVAPVSTPIVSKLPKAILIGVSTGGPNALKTLMPTLCQTSDVPVFIVQHMPPVFTKSLAESLNKACSHTIIEPVGNELVKNKYAYVAPGGKHLVLRKTPAGELMVGINENEPEDLCRPSVNVLFRSAASVCGGDVITIVLTGMGSDGTKGLKALKRAGAYCIAQDEESSVVWGMPGSVVEAGLADEVVPLGEIADRVKRIMRS